MKKLKLFVWEDVLCDWSCGIMFALANDVDEAKKLIQADKNYIPDEEFNKPPIVVDYPRGFSCYGGG